MSHSLCGEWTGARINMKTGEVTAGAIWCKSWFCEHCAPIRKRQLQAQACAGEPTRFITITSKVRRDVMTPDEAAREMVHAWRMVVQRGKREGIFKDIQYIAVFELTDKGWPHLHILARCEWLAQAWLADRMRQYSESPICWIKRIKSKKHLAWYISKYVAKAPERFQGCKRYWRTHGFDLSPNKQDKPLHDHFQGYGLDWHVDTVAGMYQAHGYQLEWTSVHSFIAIPEGINLHQTRMRNWRATHDPPPKETAPCTST